MSRAILLFAILALLGCGDQSARHEAIVGKWRSNAKLTLESMNGTKGITPQTRAFLEDDFFGYLTIEIQESKSRTTNDKDNYDSGFEPYEVLEVSDKYVRIRAWSNFYQDFDERILYLEGDCYYEIFVGYRFRTYFCRYG
jgi:hypothetical protein